MPRTACVVVLLLSAAMPVSAGDHVRHLSQYAHSAWRIRDGSLSGAPAAVTQTADGYVWIGTSTGLFRFDGVRFVPLASADTTPPFTPTSVYSVLGGHDGSLWFGTGLNLARVKDGELVDYTNALGRFNAIVEDERGSVWATRTRVADEAGPLCQVTDGKMRCHGTTEGIPIRFAGPLVSGPEGTLWFGSSSTLVRWSAGASDVYSPSAVQSTAGLSGIAALTTRPEGGVWVGFSRSGPGLGLQQFEQGILRPVALPGFDGTSVAVATLFTDRDQAIWIGTDGEGIYRVSSGQVDRFLRGDGLSGDTVTAFYQDREGNIWVTTSEGVDCLRKTPIVSFSVHEGLSANQAASVLAARDGTIWIGNEGALDSIAGGHVSSITPKDGLPGGAVTALLEDHAGRLWVGVDNRLALYDRRVFRQIPRADGTALGAVRALTEDQEQNVWALVIDNPERLVRITDFAVREDLPVPGAREAVSLAADAQRGVWLGLRDGQLARYRDGELETFPNHYGSAVRELITTSDGAVLGVSADGLVGWRNGMLRVLNVQNGLPCSQLHALVFDAHDALWLSAQCGLLRIASADLQKWWQDASAHVEVKVFDALDGARPAPASFEPKAARAPDGRLWFATDTLVQMIDPEQVTANVVPPPVHIERVVADRKSYPVSNAVRLPPLTRDLQIDYVGLSFVAPAKVLFRYRLEGHDTDWQESGNRRQAFYADLRPGSYRFRVIASNNDGVWNQEGAALDIVIDAAWYQTAWFFALGVIMSVVAVWALYALRMRQVARALNARFDERLAERTRMARDLHDTLLQTVQGSKMVADNALNRPDDVVGMRGAMEQVSRWLGQASLEGRTAVNALRSSTIETNDLADALGRALEDCRRQGTLHGSLSVSGELREMHPVVRDEVYRIGYEAIRNACTHSGASRLEVELIYGRALVVRVSDNGVGIEPAVASDGREGHFGLRGMRERAARIGAKLTVVCPVGAGTEITLVVPGRAIFRKPASSLFERMRDRFRPR